MRTDKTLLVKGLKYLAYTVALMFTAPVLLYQAFKNQDHTFFIPVLIAGAIFGLMAIALGFLGIKTVVDAVFGRDTRGSKR